MHQCHMVIAADDIAQRREPLLYPLDFHIVWQRIPQMLQFLICCRCGDKKAFTVTVLNHPECQLPRLSLLAARCWVSLRWSR